jgi:hypothetical protein
MTRWGLLCRGALAVVTTFGALANVSRAVSPGTFDVVLLSPEASILIAIESAVLAVPCLRTYDRLTPKYI